MIYTLGEIDTDHRTVRFNIPESPEDADQFLDCTKKNIKIIDDFFADNAVRNKHFRDCLEIYVARSIDDIFETNCCEVVKQHLFPEDVIPHTQEELDTLLMETNSSYTDAVNECVRIFRNGLTDDTDEELEILESKLFGRPGKIWTRMLALLRTNCYAERIARNPTIESANWLTM